MDDFSYEVMQRKRIARMAKYRKCGSKSKKCPMSTDYMTQKQWEKRCGEVHTYNLNEPKSWEQFKEMPANIQKEYLNHLVENYNVNATSLGEMFDVRPLTVRRHIDSNGLGISFKVGNSMNAEQKAEWTRFLNGTGAESDAEPNSEVELSDQENQCPEIQHINNMRGMDMKQFSLTFQGEIDASMIANSIISIAGNGAIGKVEIICTL